MDSDDSKEAGVPRPHLNSEAARRMRIFWPVLVVCLAVLAVLAALLAHAVAAGMTVFGLMAVGTAVAAFYLDHERIVPEAGISVRLKRLAMASALVCILSSIGAALEAAGKDNATVLFAVAFASSVVLGAVAVYGVSR